MANTVCAPALRGRRRIGPRLAAGVVVIFGSLVLGGCVSAGASSGIGTGPPSQPAVVAQFPPSAVPAPCLSATIPGQECGPEAVVSPPPGEGNPPTAPAALTSPTAVQVAQAGTRLVVTIADDGATLHLAVGQRFLLDLGSGVDWRVKVGDEQVVQPVTGLPLPSGCQGAYEARTPGSTVLSAVGLPHCTSGSCALFRLGFSITITVS
jgi:hypothetical protein